MLFYLLKTFKFLLFLHQISCQTFNFGEIFLNNYAKH